VRLTITISGVKEAAGQIREAIRRGVRNGIEKLLTHGQRLVQTNVTTAYGEKPPAVAFGILANSVVAEMSGELAGDLFVAPPADVYGMPVETGTRPHWPPREPILRWVKHKFGVDGKEAESIAFLVARKIAKRGTPGHLMFERAFVKLEEDALGIMEREITEEIQREGLSA
jgi:hypothetical protein